MTRLLLAALVLCSAAAHAQTDAAWRDPFAGAERMDTSRIIGGRLAPLGSFPAALQLEVARPQPGGVSRAGLACGASVIAPRWALTAAHCVAGYLPTEVAVRGGAMELAGGHRVRALQLLVHEGYNSRTFANDIALVQLAAPLDLPAAVLPDPSLADEVLAPRLGGAVVVGWGNTRFVGTNSDAAVSSRLLQARLDVLPLPVCQGGYGHFLADGSQFCAGVVDHCPAEGGCPDSCQGDSGGPLFVPHSLGLLQAGVVSYGDRCGMRGRPGVYTSVAHYALWIRQRVPTANFTRQVPEFVQASGTLAAAAGPPPVPAHPALRPAVTLSLPGGTVVKAGTPLPVRLVSNVPGWLLLFNENAAGRGALVVPSLETRRQGTLREQVRAGRPVLLGDPLQDDFELVAVPPIGRQRLVAVVVPDRTPGLEEAIAPYLDGTPIADIRVWMATLAATLPPGRIALGEVGYDIIP